MIPNQRVIHSRVRFGSFAMTSHRDDDDDVSVDDVCDRNGDENDGNDANERPLPSSFAMSMTAVMTNEQTFATRATTRDDALEDANEDARLNVHWNANANANATTTKETKETKETRTCDEANANANANANGPWNGRGNRAEDVDASTLDVERSFERFATFGSSRAHVRDAQSSPLRAQVRMDATRFAKTMRDALDARGNDARAMDVAFARRAGAMRTIDFTEFMTTLLPDAAQIAGVSVARARARVARATPSVEGATSPRAVRQHDDVANRGSTRERREGENRRQTTSARDGVDAMGDGDGLPSVRGLKTAFDLFCAFSGGAHSSSRMGVNRFLKLCEDCELYSSAFDANAAGIVFSAVTGAKSKFLDFKPFKRALALAARRAGAEYLDFARAVVARGSPLANACVSPPIRFHDDTSTYTSTHREVHSGRKLSARALSIANSPTTPLGQRLK